MAISDPTPIKKDLFFYLTLASGLLLLIPRLGLHRLIKKNRDTLGFLSRVPHCPTLHGVPLRGTGEGARYTHPKKIFLGCSFSSIEAKDLFPFG